MSSCIVRIRWFLTPLLALLVGLLCCRQRPQSSRILVLALDGMEPAVVDLLMSEGKLPNFAKLRQEGAYGRLRSAVPLLSPVVWTTIATGKPPDQHKIGHFVAINPTTGARLPVTSRMRKVKALWNIFSAAGRSVEVVGWWATWPAEAVRGAIVSDHLCYHFLMEQAGSTGQVAQGLTYPPELAASLAPLVTRPTDLTASDVAPFVKVDAEELARPFEFDDDLSHFRWALATTRSYTRIGLNLWKKERPDLGMVYVEATDSTAHLFGHLFRAEELSGELRSQQERYGHAVEAMYAYADEIVGEFIAAMDDRTVLIVLSDHGFQLGKLPDDPSRTRDMRRVSERFHTMHGILYLYGHGVRSHSRIEDPSILDVAPTALVLAGLPPAADMPGRVLAEAIDVKPRPVVPSYETDGSASETAEAGDPAIDPKILENLRSLGYLGAVSPSGDRNLAADLFESGRYEEAARAYEKLVAEQPRDVGLRTSLAGALGALGRYDEALAQIEVSAKLDPLNPEAYHNRAVIHERQGNVKAAIRDYETAVRYSPDYQPSRQALSRLGVSGGAAEPTSPEEKRAFRLAEDASLAARRGDYVKAMKTLDEAQRVAPRYALIYQYRSNVAYLMGDRAAAADALRKGLELEPDNALFRENLKRLTGTTSR
jgi:predicted AlkP superfamily phosphohydrolase/phosphomutase/Flp pilus assembly protein TadD